MTSRISSVKIRMEDMRHRPAMILISFFVFFLRDLALYIVIQNSRATYTGKQILKEYRGVLKHFTGPDLAHLVYLIPLAMLLAVNGFHYLHNRSRVDFFHALPAGRGRFFRMILGNDLVIFLVPYLISLVAESFYVRHLGCFDQTYRAYLFYGVIFNVLIFLLMYLLMTLCMMLTGQTFVSLLAFFVFVLYSPLFLNLMIESYAGIFFRTFSKLPSLMIKILDWLSPISVSYHLSEQYKLFAGGGISSRSLAVYLPVLVWIIVLLAAGYVAYRKFPSESAGNAMTFKRGRKLIKFLIVVPLAMYGGLFFYQVTLSRSFLWMYFGVVFGAIFFHAIVECIYRSDIRGLWSSKVDLLFIMIFAVLAVLCFDVDIVKYDRRIPDMSGTAYIKVADNYYYYQDVFEEAKGIPAEKTGKLAGIFDRITDQVELTDENDPQVYVRYYYGSGRMEERRFPLKEEMMDELEKELYTMQEYKDMIYPVLKASAAEIKEITCQHPTVSFALNLKQEEKEAFLEIFKEELRQVEYEELITTQPVARLEIFRAGKKDENGDSVRDESETYDIYPSFKKTIAFLKEHGATTGASASGYTLDHVELFYEVEDGEESEITYKSYFVNDPKLIEAVKDKLVFMDLNGNYIANRRLDSSNYISARIDGVEYDFWTDPETIEEIYKQVTK